MYTVYKKEKCKNPKQGKKPEKKGTNGLSLIIR